uniref:Prenyltransferase alpha-alpha toroid domain-containing protein n=1 Tax=uncultured bacterium DX-7F-24 TaxID=1292054 RepID=M1LGY8_9BACT|nr:hypothetical protein [uncultured bacterium DX-7F-24]
MNRPHADRISSARDRAADYLLSRQSPKSGFCFYRAEYIDEPNLSDTFHALAALRLLGRKPRWTEGVAAFVAGFARRCQPYDLFHRTGILLALDPNYTPEGELQEKIRALKAPPTPERHSTDLATWFELTQVIVQLKRRFDLLDEPMALRAEVLGLLHDGGFGTGPDLLNTWAAIEILRDCGGPLDLPGLAEFLRRIQVPSLGFTMTLSSRMGRLELVAAGVATCQAVGVRIRYREDATDFVLACQAGDGGFAGAPDALPDITLTHRALETLIPLSKDL